EPRDRVLGPRRQGDDPAPLGRRRTAPGAAPSDTDRRQFGMTSPGSVEGSGRLRLFCALRLPDPALDRIVAWQAEHLRGGGRPAGRDQLHATLAFLGARPAADLAAIVA